MESLRSAPRISSNSCSPKPLRIYMPTKYTAIPIGRIRNRFNFPRISSTAPINIDVMAGFRRYVIENILYPIFSKYHHWVTNKQSSTAIWMKGSEIKPNRGTAMSPTIIEASPKLTEIFIPKICLLTASKKL